MAHRTANVFGMELVVQSVNQLAQTTEFTVSQKVNAALLAGSDVALDTKKVVLDGTWGIVSPTHLAYLGAKFTQPPGKVLESSVNKRSLGTLSSGKRAFLSLAQCWNRWTHLRVSATVLGGTNLLLSS